MSSYLNGIGAVRLQPLTPPPLARDLLLKSFPEYTEDIQDFSEIESTSMQSLSESLSDDRFKIVLAIYRDLLDPRSNLFLDLINCMNRRIDQFDQIFEHISREEFSLPQSLFLAEFSLLNFVIYLDQIKELSSKQCLEGINNPSWYRVVDGCMGRSNNSYLRIDNLSNLVTLSVIQCQVAEKIALHAHYENQFDICSQVKELSDQEGQWALDMIERLTARDLGEVINFMSEEIPFHQALILVRFTQSKSQANDRRGEVQPLYLFQCIRLADLISDGSSFNEAISQATRSQEDGEDL